MAFCRRFKDIAILGCLTALAVGQIPPCSAPRRSFDVASVRPAGLRETLMPMQRSGGRITLTTDRLGLIVDAFCVNAWQIVGINQDSNYIYIEAETTPSATDEQVSLMLQSLLIERFKLSYHYQFKKGKVYSLLASRKGPKITARTLGEPPAPFPAFASILQAAPGTMISMRFKGEPVILGREVTLAQLCLALTSALHVPVIDRTGLTGKFDIDLRIRHAAGPPDPTSVIDAVKDQLGFDLKPGIGNVIYFVVDHIAKSPVPN